MENLNTPEQAVNTSPMKGMVERLETISLHLSELQALIVTIHDSGSYESTTGSLVSIAERLANLLQEDVIALMTTCHQSGREVQS